MQVNWLADVLSPMQNPRLKVAVLDNKDKNRGGVTHDEMIQFYKYIEPYLYTGETDLQIYNMLKENDKLTKNDGNILSLSTIETRIKKARKYFDVEPNARGPRPREPKVIKQPKEEPIVKVRMMRTQEQIKRIQGLIHSMLHKTKRDKEIHDALRKSGFLDRDNGAKTTKQAIYSIISRYKDKVGFVRPPVVCKMNVIRDLLMQGMDNKQIMEQVKTDRVYINYVRHVCKIKNHAGNKKAMISALTEQGHGIEQIMNHVKASKSYVHSVRLTMKLKDNQRKNRNGIS